MYICKKSISHLHMYITGYLHRQYEIDDTFRTKFELFSDFVNNYYNAKTSAVGWAHIILLYEQDEKQAFYKFYDLFHIFIND